MHVVVSFYICFRYGKDNAFRAYYGPLAYVSEYLLVTLHSLRTAIY